MSSRTAYEVPVEKNGYKFIRLRSGRLLTFLDVVTEYKDAHTSAVRAMSRAFKLATDDWDVERLELLIDDLDTYAGALRKHLKDVQVVRSKKERIALLRNVTGRTEEEAAMFLRKADELERQL